MRVIAVAVAGALGALSRYGIGVAVGPRRFPWATLGVNVVGSFLLGVVLTLAGERDWSPEVVAALGIGFLGAFTTFSTFSWDTFQLGRTDRVVAAGAYVLASVVLAVVAAALGHLLARSSG